MELYKLRSEVESAEPETDQAHRNQINILAGICALENETSSTWWIGQEDVTESFLLVLKKISEQSSMQRRLSYSGIHMLEDKSDQHG